MYSETVDLFDEAWKRLSEEFTDQKAILTYLQKTYLSIRHQWARCFIREYPNLGTKTTSPTEGSNHSIKSYVINGNCDLHRVALALQEMITRQERVFNEAVAIQQTRLRFDYINKAWLGNVPLTVSYWAVNQIDRQYRMALAARPSARQPFPPPLPRCQGVFSNQYGLPCSHTIYERLEAGEPLEQWDIHPQWHLERSLVSGNSLLICDLS